MSDIPPPPTGGSQPGWGGSDPSGGWPSQPPPPPTPGPPGGGQRHIGLRPVGEFLSAAFGLLGRAALPILPILIVVAVPVVLSVIAADAALGLTEWLEESLERMSTAEPTEPVDLPSLDASDGEIVTWLTLVAGTNLIGAIAVFVAGTVTLAEVRSGDAPTTRQILSRSTRIFPALVGLGLTVIGLSVAVLLILVVVAVVAGPVVILAVLSLLPLSLFLFARLAVVMPAAVIEHRGASALARSWELTRGHGWGVLGRSMLFSVLLTLAVNLVTAPLSFFGFLGTAVVVLATITTTIIGLAVYAAAQAGPMVLYDDLRQVLRVRDGHLGPGRLG